MEKLRSHVKVGLASSAASCCAMLLAAALDWFSGLPLHYGVFVAPMAWAAMLYAGAVAGRVRGHQRSPSSHARRETLVANGASAGRASRRGIRGRGAIIKSAVFLPRQGVGAAGCPEHEEVCV